MCTMPATVDVSTTAQSATLVYQIDRSNGVLTLSPSDAPQKSRGAFGCEAPGGDSPASRVSCRDAT